MAPPENAPLQLLVEGTDDKWSLINVIARHGIDWDSPHLDLPHVRDCEGLDNLLGVQLPLIISNPSAYRVVGAVIDANTDVSVRWNRMRGILQSHGINCPPSPPADGLVVPGNGGNSRVGVWLMPDNSLTGALEDFLATLVPAGDACWDYAETAVDEAKQRGATYHTTDQLKARLHTWLAWHDPPGLPFGAAITAQLFAADSDVALRFVDWFRLLFSIP